MPTPKRKRETRGRKPIAAEYRLTEQIAIKVSPQQLEVIMAAKDIMQRRIKRAIRTTHFVRDSTLEWSQRIIDSKEEK